MRRFRRTIEYNGLVDELLEDVQSSSGSRVGRFNCVRKLKRFQSLICPERIKSDRVREQVRCYLKIVNILDLHLYRIL